MTPASLVARAALRRTILAIGVLPFRGAANAAGLGAAFGSVAGFTRTVRHRASSWSSVPADLGAINAHDNLAINRRDQLRIRGEDDRDVILSVTRCGGRPTFGIPTAATRIEIASKCAPSASTCLCSSQHSVAILRPFMEHPRTHRKPRNGTHG